MRIAALCLLLALAAPSTAQTVTVTPAAWPGSPALIASPTQVDYILKASRAYYAARQHEAMRRMAAEWAKRDEKKQQEELKRRRAVAPPKKN